jgi:N-methylhydantoinase A
VPPYRLGVDIGGTFTDFSLLDEATGTVLGFKWPTVPADPARGVVEGLRPLVAEHALAPAAIGYLVHGTTIAINTVIQRTAPRSACSRPAASVTSWRSSGCGWRTRSTSPPRARSR